jgi:manganese/zinc/iron transport system substrate-binding protein
MRFVRFLPLLTVLVFAACAGAEPAPKFTIVATTSQVADAVRHVAGDRADVVSLLGEGVDPHLYRLSRSDVAQLRAADIVFYNGLMLEGKMVDALDRLRESGKPVYAVAELIEPGLLMAPEEFEGAFDPHVWMDPIIWSFCVRAIADALAEFDPDGRDGYMERFGQQSMRLIDLSAYGAQMLATVPAESRVLVTAHDAFNYFGRRYNLEVMGIQGISTESEAGVRRIESLVNLIVERKIPSVFVETTVSDRNVQALIEGAAARGHTLRIGGRLFSDAMGPAGSYEGTCLGMLDHNITTIAVGLGGKAPDRGFIGRLAEPILPLTNRSE